MATTLTLVLEARWQVWGDALLPTGDNHMVYNSADQLTRWPGMRRYFYDDAGNLTEVKNDAETATIAGYAYTPAGLLNVATFKDKTGSNRTLTNVWDAHSNRVGFSIAYGNYGFVYDTTAGIPAVIEETTPDGVVYYIREPDGALIASILGSDARYYHFDALGSTRLLTDSGGTVTDKYAYDAYGALLAHDGSTDQPYQYVGQLGYYTHYKEPDFGLMQLGVRLYDAQVGRFGQVDREAIAEEASYSYCSGRPVALVDATGRSPIAIGIVGVAGAVAVCINRAHEKAVDMHERNDKLAHCYMACKASECLTHGLCVTYLVPALMSRGEGDPDDREANRRGGQCARDQMLPWPLNRYPDCYTCCKAKVKGLPNDPGRIR